MKTILKHKLLSIFILGALAGICGICAVSYAQPATQNPVLKLPASLVEQLKRPCAPANGVWEKVDCSAVAAATSTRLKAWGRYVVQCFSESYVEWGDAATDVATNADGTLPTKSWMEFITTDRDNRYFSCLNVSTDTDCRILECR